MIDMSTQKEAVAKTARNVVDGTVSAGTKAVEASAGAAETAADKLKDVLARSKTFAETGINKVTAVKVGDKNVGEHAHATVETVQSAVDVDQITDQVAKLREQIEGVLGNWKETFRPTTEATPEPVADKPAKKAAATKTAAKKPATKKATKKPATKKPAASKTTAKKPASKKATTSKTTAKKTAAKKPAAKKATSSK